MSERPAERTSPSSPPDPATAESGAPPRVVEATPFVTASHAALFTPEEGCAVCAGALPDADDDEHPHAPAGKGLLLWTRGDERRAEEPSLCPTCGTAIGLAALHRMQIEEDEG